MRELNWSEQMQAKLLSALVEAVEKEVAVYTDSRYGHHPAPDYVISTAMDTVIKRVLGQ